MNTVKLGIFIDTVIICKLTRLQYYSTLVGIPMLILNKMLEVSNMLYIFIFFIDLLKSANNSLHW